MLLLTQLLRIKVLYKGRGRFSARHLVRFINMRGYVLDSKEEYRPDVDNRY